MIQLNHVTKKYGDFTAVSDLSLHIREGELVVLLGPSGCGKSTTIRTINKLIPITSGEILVNGKNVDSYHLESLRKDMGYVIQSVGLFPHMTVMDNIALPLKLQNWNKEDIKKRVSKMLTLVGLDPEQYSKKHPSELSGGEAQRIGVARALAPNPPILLMDEPFGAVDPLNRKRLQMEFMKIQRELKKTVVFVTHDVEEAILMGDKIAIMNHGKLEAFDTPNGLILRGSSSFARQFLGQEYAVKILTKYKVKDIVKKESLSGTEQIDENATVMQALSLMIEGNVSYLQVIDQNGAETGSIHLDDIINILREVD